MKISLLIPCFVDQFYPQVGMSIVRVSAPSAGGRALSILPPHHVVLARRHQMVSDLTVALLRVQEKFKKKSPVSSPSSAAPAAPVILSAFWCWARTAQTIDHSASALNHFFKLRLKP